MNPGSTGSRPRRCPTGDVVTAVPLQAGVILRTSDLRVAVGATDGAMSIPVPPSRAAGGLLVTGDRVDVIAEADGEVGYVATDLTVLAVSEPGTGLTSTASSHAVTVEVDQEQALAIAQGMASGEVDVVRTAQGDGQ